MLKNIAAALSLTVLTLGLAACGSAEESTPTSVVTEVTTVSTTTSLAETSLSTTSEEKTPSSEAEPKPSQSTYVVPTTEAYVEPTVNPWAGSGNGWRCAATDAWVIDPSYCTSEWLGGDPSYDTNYGPSAAISAEQHAAQVAQLQEQGRLANIPIADGGTCPAYKCGYGHDENGNRNPSSGEIQTLHGCDEGYITDVELCAAVEWVRAYGY